MGYLLINSRDFVEYILEILASFGQIQARKMFGGYGIYKDDCFFAIISDDELYFKVDQTNLANYQIIDSHQFSYKVKDGLNHLSYWSVPIDVLEDSDKLFNLISGAYKVALSNKIKIKNMDENKDTGKISMLKEIRNDLKQYADVNYIVVQERFFKTGRGEYSEGDIFTGIRVPDIRKVVKKHLAQISFSVLEKLIKSKYHEERMFALLTLVDKVKKKNINMQEFTFVYKFYLSNIVGVNNWDLVDASAAQIIGKYCSCTDTKKIYSLARSKNMWERRIAMVATLYEIKNGEPKLALEIAKILVNDTEDLMHKAVGWMLKESAKRCSIEPVEEFLRVHGNGMSRTMLRYAIENFPTAKKKYYMSM